MTVTLREHRRTDFITRVCPTAYAADARCPTWLRFLERIFDGDRELIAYMQRWFGYCLTGTTREQIMQVWWGSGANGKTTLATAILEMLGPDYAGKAPRDLLMRDRSDRHPTALAALHGKRLVFCTETDETGRLDEALVKELTGGDPITARRMREDHWTFTPTHKLVLVTNHRPSVRGSDHAVWRRIHLVPFTVAIPPAEQDKSLIDQLRAEREGILAWCVRGCVEWQNRGGLEPPQRVVAATAEYRASQDIVGQFLTECCITRPGASIRAGELYAAFRAYCENEGEHTLSQRLFGAAMTERGFRRRHSGGVWYEGLALR